MNDTAVYDLIIMGGGLVGASLAVSLQQLPLKIALIEAHPWSNEKVSSPTYDDRTLALSYSSYRIFHAMGLWAQIAPYATDILRIHVSEQGKFGFTRLNNQLLRTPALGYVVTARHLGHIVQMAVNQAVVDLFAPALLEQVKTHSNSVTLQIMDQGHRRELCGRLLIAADGSQSAVCRQLHIHSTAKEYGQAAVIATVTAQYAHQNTAYERFTSTGPMALLPLRDNDCALIWTFQQAEIENIMAWSDARFLQELQRQFGWRLGQLTKVGRRQAYPLHFIQVHAYQQPRVVVIGNAAHTLHPVAGQGFNLGLRDVATLSEILMTEYRAGRDIGNPTGIQRYLDCQRRDQRQVAHLTNYLVKLFSNRITPLVLLRNLGLLTLDSIPPFKRIFTEQMTGLRAYPSRLVRGLK